MTVESSPSRRLGEIEEASADIAGSLAADAVDAHVAATDPHGDRAYADTLVADIDSPVTSVNDETGAVVLDAADVGAVPASYLDTDGTLAADSDVKVATQKATRTYVAQKLADLVNSAPGLLDTLGELAAAITADEATAATLATLVGTKVPQARTVNGHALSADVTVTATDVSAVPASYLDTDGTLAADSDVKVATQKAIRTYLAAAIAAAVKVVPVNLGSTMSGTVDCPIAAGQYTGMFYGTLTGSVTITLSGSTSGAECEWLLSLTQDGTGGRVITWPTAKWAGGVAPVLSTAAGANDHVLFRSRDGGTTVYGFLLGKGMA